jgi:RNA recognition motif-containing protein
MKTTGHEVARANIMTTPDGKSKGCGIVEFATVEGAQQAVLTLNDTELNGRQIFVREDREDKNSGGGYNSNNRGFQGHRFSSGAQSQSRRTYVGNLAWDVRTFRCGFHSFFATC